LPPDVAPAHWASGSVRAAVAHRLMDLRAGRFDGKENATRLDLARAAGTVLALRGKARGPTQAVKDLPPGSPEARAVGLALGSGAMKARKGKLGPGQPITRDELAIAVSRLLTVVRSEPEGPIADPVELNDVPPDSPMYAPIQRCLKAKMISTIASKFEGYNPVPRYMLAAVMTRFLDPRASRGSP
jgi:hypothetical protein